MKNSKNGSKAGKQAASAARAGMSPMQGADGRLLPANNIMKGSKVAAPVNTKMGKNVVFSID